MAKRDRLTNYPFNYIVIFSNGEDNFKKCLINARDKKQALFLSLKRFCREFPDCDVSRVRIADIIPTKHNTIERSIKDGIL